MSALKSLRDAIAAEIVAAGILPSEQVLTKRRTNIWNDIAVAIGASDSGSVIVVGTAKGKRDTAPNSRPRKGFISMRVTVPITFFETPVTDPTGTEEDETFERMLTTLEGSKLGAEIRETRDMQFEEFTEEEDEEYLIRQAIFTCRLTMKRTEPTP